MRRFTLYFVALAHLCSDLGPGALPAILPFFVLHNGISFTEVAGLMFASSFLSSIVQPAFGLMADRASRHWFMPLGVLMTGVSLALTGLTSNYWLIFIAITMMGLGSAIFHPEAARFVNSISGNHRGQGIGIFSVGGNAGFAVGPLIAVAALGQWGTKGTLSFAVIAVVMSAILFVVITTITSQKSAKQGDDSASTSAEERPAPKAVNENATNDWPAFLRLTAVIIARSIIFCSVIAFMPLFCIERFGISEAVAGTTLSLFATTGIVMTLFGGWLSDRIGMIRCMNWSFALAAPALLGLLLAPSMAWVFAILIVICFSLQVPYPAFVVLGQTYLGRNVGFASGVTLGLSFSIGGMVVPLLGMVADHSSIATVMQILVGIGLACAVLSHFLPQPQALVPAAANRVGS